MTLVLILSGALALLMAGVESVNYRRTGQLTFLTAAHVLIAIAYCVPPYLIWLLPGTAFEAGLYAEADPNPWGRSVYLLDLANHLSLPIGAYLTSMMLVCGGYIIMVAGYFLAHRIPVPRLDAKALSLGGVAGSGAVLGALAAAALVVYSSQFQGLTHFIHLGLNIRGGADVDLKFGYLQVLSQVAFPAFLFLTAAALRLSGAVRGLVILLATIAWITASVRLLHAGGRLELGMFLLTPLLAAMFVARSRRTAVVIAAAVAVAVLFAANLPHTFGRDPFAALGSVAINLVSDTGRRLLFVVADLGFPHLVSAHTLTMVPDPIPYRYFIDIPLGLLYMLPNFSGVETLPPMILSLQVKYLPWIPVDLFSLGYYSMGAAGVLITFAAFGALLAVFDKWLTESAGWLGQALRAAWLFYLPFRLLYADPYAALQSGFGLITGTLVVIGLAVLARRRTSGA
jgi:hypothetical protein